MLSFKSKITITAKRIKYLVINLPTEAKDLYLESYETLMKEIKDSQIERYTMFLDWKNQYCENGYTIQSNPQIQCNPYNITNGIVHRITTKILQFVWKYKRH